MPHKKGFLFSDGGARGNPGIAGAGAVLYNEEKQIIWKGSKFCGETTNNVAEYMGLIIGLEKALELEITDLTVFMDSNLIVEQMNGNWKVKNIGLKPLFEKAKALAEKIPEILFQHIPREKNKIADRLANEAMDRRM